MILGSGQSRAEAFGHAVFWSLFILVVVPLAIFLLFRQAMKKEDDHAGQS